MRETLRDHASDHAAISLETIDCVIHAQSNSALSVNRCVYELHAQSDYFSVQNCCIIVWLFVVVIQCFSLACLFDPPSIVHNRLIATSSHISGRDFSHF